MQTRLKTYLNVVIVDIGGKMPIRDYKITYHSHKVYEPIVYIKNRFVNARGWIEKLMMGLEPGEKIIIERKGK